MGWTDKLKNKKDEAKGAAKEQFGKATDDEQMKREGKIDQTKSNLKQAGEKVKDAFNKDMRVGPVGAMSTPPRTQGNLVRPLIHGATYFAERHHRVSQMCDGALLMFDTGPATPSDPRPHPQHAVSLRTPNPTLSGLAVSALMAARTHSGVDRSSRGRQDDCHAQRAGGVVLAIG